MKLSIAIEVAGEKEGCFYFFFLKQFSNERTTFCKLVTGEDERYFFL